MKDLERKLLETVAAKRGRAGIEPGAASIRIELRGGDVTVRHGESGKVLAAAQAVPIGTWEKLWQALEALGLERTEE